MSAQEQIFREFLETYNRIVEECFNRCVYTFNYRYLLDDEIECTSRCTSKYANYNQRMAMNFGEIHAKKLIEMQEGAEAQQSIPFIDNQTNNNTNPTTS